MYSVKMAASPSISDLTFDEFLELTEKERWGDMDNHTLYTLEQFHKTRDNFRLKGKHTNIFPQFRLHYDEKVNAFDYKKRLFEAEPFLGDILPFPGVFLAGSAAAFPLFSERVVPPGKKPERFYNDFDFYINVGDPAIDSTVDSTVGVPLTTEDIANRFLKHIDMIFLRKQLHEGRKMYIAEIIRRNGTITVHIPGKKIQLILRRYPSIAACINDFDLGSSAIAFNGNEVYISKQGAYTLTTGCNLLNLTRRNENYEDRLSKYFGRGIGFTIPNKEGKDFRTESSRILNVKFNRLVIEGVNKRDLNADGSLPSSFSAIRLWATHPSSGQYFPRIRGVYPFSIEVGDTEISGRDSITFYEDESEKSFPLTSVFDVCIGFLDSKETIERIVDQQMTNIWVKLVNTLIGGKRHRDKTSILRLQTLGCVPTDIIVPMMMTAMEGLRIGHRVDLHGKSIGEKLEKFKPELEARIRPLLIERLKSLKWEVLYKVGQSYGGFAELKKMTLDEWLTCESTDSS
jgi:hypothetical protein